MSWSLEYGDHQPRGYYEALLQPLQSKQERSPYNVAPAIIVCKRLLGGWVIDMINRWCDQCLLLAGL